MKVKNRIREKDNFLTNKRKSMIKKTLKYLTIFVFSGIILFTVFYLVYPKATYRILRNTAVKVSENLVPSERYDNKYGIHPYLLHKVELVLNEAKQKGIDLRVVSGFRDLKKQQALYNQGRTTKGYIVTNAAPGLSYHNHGWAVDVCEYKNGKPDWKSKHWEEIGAIGKKHGLVWGGDWTRLVDKPHLQLSLFDILKITIKIE